MSTSQRFYSLDAAKLGSLIGSGDHSLIDLIHSKEADVWTTEDDFGDDEERLTSDAALCRILDGELSDQFVDDLTAALEMLCRRLGEDIPMPSFEDFHWSFLGELVVANELLATRLPFPFPYNPEGYPRACFLSRKRIPELVDTLLEDVPEHRDLEINAIRVEFWEMLESVADEGNDIVAFYGS